MPHTLLVSRRDPSSRNRVSSQEWPIPPAELQRRRAKAPYETEMFFRGEELSDFVYDEENDLFRLEGTAGLPSHGPRPILRC